MLWAVIMAGGSGTRFWPASRQKTPKQFLSLFGKKTLIEDTVHRLRGVIPMSRIIVVTQEDKVTTVRKLLKIPRQHIIGEPIGRNTAPCAALAAALALKSDPNAVIALLPADHEIGKPKLFKKLLRVSAQVAKQERIPVTFGMKPDQPHTGYGYLEKGKKFSKVQGLDVFRLKQFHEKPNLSKAKRFVKSKRYLWNSGMFVWSARDVLHATKKYLPKIDRLVTQIFKGSFQKNMKRLFPKMPSISIDYGLMEPLKGSILTIPVDLKWNDLGGWMSFSGLWPQDRNLNVSKGNVLFVDGKRNFVKGGERLIAVLGADDLVVVDTEDALLVCPKDQSEKVRKVVDLLRSKKKHRYL